MTSSGHEKSMPLFRSSASPYQAYRARPVGLGYIFAISSGHWLVNGQRVCVGLLVQVGHRLQYIGMRCSVRVYPPMGLLEDNSELPNR
ncbi:uncharacterized protein PGTG_00225 [Puccinia graminis f. sp. tritici CRL 75-36-700-3]|uniref:Uncharacterized protein n=1 Tax=Puccinia graminis f. sp. tritici (strain CRL 75-36-700-3 / race SCCL) TaxID=418459 RepID=E3JPS9_PUCGT|nr:uncharacterized protein PGTG_00225 [Puccinia graminis f. sp. tritici CRL 75-36-700-3]EFP74269.1 hypothetical protein PGTG_00225 [Puccinia graminis f. sp. tritici CRL 75-36-700-3]